MNFTASEFDVIRVFDVFEILKPIWWIRNSLAMQPSPLALPVSDYRSRSVYEYADVRWIGLPLFPPVQSRIHPSGISESPPVGHRTCPQVSLSAVVTTECLSPPPLAPAPIPAFHFSTSSKIISEAIADAVVRVPMSMPGELRNLAVLWAPGQGQVSHRGRGPKQLWTWPCFGPLTCLKNLSH